MLELKNLTFEVPLADGSKETKRIIDDLSLTIPDGRFTVITGPNGGGKSTLAKLIMGVEARDERPDPAGRRGHHRPVHLRARQEGHRLRFPTARTLQGHEGEEAAGHRGRQRSCRCSRATSTWRRWACARPATSTREVDKNLSGGEVKRIEIATILARDPKLAIYDEPEAGIDLWSFDRLTETFRRHPRRRATAAPS